MAWHIGEFVQRGEIDNRVRGKITGRLWLAGRTQPLELVLMGNAGRDVAGCRWSWVHPKPQLGQLDMLADCLEGKAGECTASRKLRVPEIPPKEARPGLGPPILRWHWRNGVYFEWFCPRLGRVIVASTEYHVEQISEPVWRMTDDEAAVQRRLVTSAQSQEVATADAVWRNALTRPSPGGLPRLIERIRQRLAHEGAQADFERIVEEEITRRRTGGPFPAGETAPPPWPVADAAETWRLAHPLVMRAHALALRLLEEPSAQGWLPVTANPEHPMADQVASTMKAAIKLAGGLNGRAQPPLPEECGSALGWLRQAYEYFEDALCAAADCAQQQLAGAVWQTGVRAELTELAQETAALIEELERREARGLE